MKLKVILVEPHYDGNLGFVCRAMKNFKANELCLVNPVADKNSSEAKSRAMHAQDILKKSKTVKSLKKALEDCDLSIATTCTSSKTKIFRTTQTPKEIAEQLKAFSGKIALVFGREPTGLTNKEINQCDIIASIPTANQYKSMNLSHSATVFFYEFFQAKWKKKQYASKQVREKMNDYFEQLVNAKPKIKSKLSAIRSFKALTSRAPLTDKEARNLINVFKRLN